MKNFLQDVRDILNTVYRTLDELDIMRKTKFVGYRLEVTFGVYST